MKKNKDLFITFDEELERLQEIKRTTLEGIQSREDKLSSRIKEIEKKSEDLISEANKVSEENKRRAEKIDRMLSSL